MIHLESKLNGPQLKAATTLDGALLIIAGAGSGKTRVITYRIARMLEKGIPQSNILALTFTNKAAREMESRVKELTGKKLNSLTVSTFHAFGVKILREEIEALGYRKNFSIYDSTDKLELIKECLRECRLFGEKTDLKMMETLFSNVKTGRLKWGRLGGDRSGGQSSYSLSGRIDTAEAGIADEIFEPAYDEYQRSLKIYNALDFDDLLILPISLFENFPLVLDKYRSRYRYILVDEFQDTSLIQYRLLRLLTNPESGKSNICVVGDDDQSIYSWRGANYENLLLFEKDFPRAMEIKLEQNYRSTTTILEAANGLISHNTNRKGKTLWSGNGEGRPIELSYPENESAEAAFIARTIKKLRFAEQRNYDHFGVLVRTNNQFDIIEEAFLAENIPYRVSGGKSFFDRKEIRDILSYLRVIANNDDDVNLLRIINTPRRGIGKAGIQHAAEIAKKHHTSIHDALSRIAYSRQHSSMQETLFEADIAHNPAPGHNQAGEFLLRKTEKTTGGGIEEFVELIHGLREDFFSGGAQRSSGQMNGAQSVGNKLSQKVRHLTDKIDYWSYLVTEHSKDEKKARWKFSNIEFLIKMIEDWENDPDNLEQGLYAYLNRISLLTRSDGEEDNGKNGAAKVNLMTIHASKGLEFPVVFIAGAEEGIIPHERSIEEGDEVSGMEEERRLFYVAITRARDKLYISSCQKRSSSRRGKVEGENERAPSPFLTEIPAHLVRRPEEEEGSGDEDKNCEDTKAFFASMRERFSL